MHSILPLMTRILPFDKNAIGGIIWPWNYNSTSNNWSNKSSICKTNYKLFIRPKKPLRPFLPKTTTRNSQHGSKHKNRWETTIMPMRGITAARCAESFGKSSNGHQTKTVYEKRKINSIL